MQALPVHRLKSCSGDTGWTRDVYVVGVEVTRGSEAAEAPDPGCQEAGVEADLVSVMEEERGEDEDEDEDEGEEGGQRDHRPQPRARHRGAGEVISN